MHARPCWRHASAELFAPQRPCRWSGGMGPSRLGTWCVWAGAHVLAARGACRRVVVGAGGRGSRAAGLFARLSSMRKGAGLRRGGGGAKARCSDFKGSPSRQAPTAGPPGGIARWWEPAAAAAACSNQGFGRVLGQVCACPAVARAHAILVQRARLCCQAQQLRRRKGR